MTDFKSAMAAVGFLVTVATISPATAQQVLVCQTLHNDLANFDRRAAAVDKVQAAINTVSIADEAKEKAAAFNCAAGNVFATNCEARKAETGQRKAHLDEVIISHTRSRIGGADPVRLNIIAAMRDNGCLEYESITAESIETTPPPVDNDRIVRAKD